MLFNLDFASNPILSYFFFFIITDLHFSVAELVIPIGIPTKEAKAEIETLAELVIPIGIPTKEAKAEIETHPVNVEITISGQYNSKLYKLFYASYSIIHIDLFL